ncbi:hypothetical protein [Streptomyces sp. NPDC059262]
MAAGVREAETPPVLGFMLMTGPPVNSRAGAFAQAVEGGSVAAISGLRSR